MTIREARVEAARRGKGWTTRRDARRLGGWYVRSPVPKISRAEWARMLRVARCACHSIKQAAQS